MALAMLRVTQGSKGKATAHSDYVAREGKYKNYSRDEKLESKGHGNMPKWAKNNPSYFWQMADEHERKNGSTYREHIIALPRELKEDQRLELVKEWIKSEIGDNHAYQYAIHNPIGKDGKEQPHVHLMFNEREYDGIERDPSQYFKRYNAKNPDRGGCRKLNTGLSHKERKQNLIEQRQRWEEVCNKHLEKAGSRQRISMAKGDKQGRHIPYEMMKRPEVEQAYREELQAKSSFQQGLQGYMKLGDYKQDLKYALAFLKFEEVIKEIDNAPHLNNENKKQLKTIAAAVTSRFEEDPEKQTEKLLAIAERTTELNSDQQRQFEQQPVVSPSRSKGMDIDL